MNDDIKPLRASMVTRAAKKFKRKMYSREESGRPKNIPFNLFDNEPNFLEDEIKNVKAYAEYGVGASTKYVLKFSDAKISCMDSDPYWMEKACADFMGSPRLTTKVVDLGDVLSWGIPVGSGKAENFHRYVNWFYEEGDAPELLLIDGRFRVCCFLTALQNMSGGGKIIFDDYVFRPQYHFVENFLKPHQTKGRQALFKVPEAKRWNREHLDLAIEAFRFNLN